MLREVERRLDIAGALPASAIRDPRALERVVHGLNAIIRFRMLMIATGYEDGINAEPVQRDPMFKLAPDRLPEQRDLCLQSTVSRAENPSDLRALLRMDRAMLDYYCESFHQVLRRIVLNIDDTFDAVHSGKQLCLFNAYYDEYGFQPIVVFDDKGRMIAAVRALAKRQPRWLRVRLASPSQHPGKA